ncbi:MAG TPA: Hsp33 family molecular chaperone HslO [Candidatus Binatia bacterium]|nr:Hsp33 family molecular chaperone HslO [Candidatus Binatia bacterium]
MSAHQGETAVERYRRLRAERLAGPPRWVEPVPSLAEDTLWRGLTREGELRVLVARTTRAASETARRLGCSDGAARVAAELVTAGLLVRSTLNPEAQLQISIANPGSAGRLLADVWAGEAGVRASIARPGSTAERDGPLLAEGVVNVVRTRGRREPYRSSTTFLASGIGDTMMEYLLHSEQILSFLRLEVAVADGDVSESLGFLVQAMPEGSRADLERLVRNLEGLPPLLGAMSPDDPDGRAWAAELLAGFRWDQCARERVAYACRCSRERVLAMLASLPQKDVLDLVSAGEPAETTCEFCRAVYRVAPSELAGLLSPPH